MRALVRRRLLPVVRTYISFPAGLSEIRTGPFAVATILGAIPWNLALAYAGLQAGNNYDAVERTLGKFTIPAVILVVVLIGVAYYFGKRMGVEERVLEKVAEPGD